MTVRELVIALSEHEGGGVEVFFENEEFLEPVCSVRMEDGRVILSEERPSLPRISGGALV